MTRPSEESFGDVGQRAKVKTTDIVCDQWCAQNRITGYPGAGNGSDVADKACAYYQTLYSFDPSG